MNIWALGEYFEVFVPIFSRNLTHREKVALLLALLLTLPFTIHPHVVLFLCSFHARGGTINIYFRQIASKDYSRLSSRMLGTKHGIKVSAGTLIVPSQTLAG